ncbi:hypothetical protein [Mucilaginibacter gotjawali]|uniref:Transcriptional regulator n=2 Tax=Mucilaginibacter gotjawali TaxID=1550579 RepID=A0A839S7L2_9SPHI|nr:hypothetical protein [Mucilaginibacter gotjawali]MBB3053776.1 putative transcriptional regulator [Mucilaginibacter gotjawali]BAU54039.1 hypothetical protein MgSA37_02210 [Mucilaginibacter gotjawali]
MTSKNTTLTSCTAVQQKVEGLLALTKITLKDIEDFSPAERQCLERTTTQTLAKLKDAERDTFLNKIELIIPAATKSSIWEYNHLMISDAIARLMRHHGVMPTKTAIAEETGLSRQTINKHFAAYKAQPEFIAQMEQFKFMAPKILANVFKYASSGDMRAARLYFEMVGALHKTQTTVVNEQNNYIQINNTIISQENLKALSTEQLNQIERIITHKAEKTSRPAEITDPIRI